MVQSEGAAGEDYGMKPNIDDADDWLTIKYALREAIASEEVALQSYQHLDGTIRPEYKVGAARAKRMLSKYRKLLAKLQTT